MKAIYDKQIGSAIMRCMSADGAGMPSTEPAGHVLSKDARALSEILGRLICEGRHVIDQAELDGEQFAAFQRWDSGV